MRIAIPSLGLLFALCGCFQSSISTTASPVELRCQPLLGLNVRKISVANRTNQLQRIELLGFCRYRTVGDDGAFWRQPLEVRPHATWEAIVYGYDFNKLQARDARSHVLSEIQTEITRTFPIVALHSKPDWQPFRRERIFGTTLASMISADVASWHVVSPSDFPLHAADLCQSAAVILGDINPNALSESQIATLRDEVSWAGLILTGGSDLRRLHGWHRAGLLPASIQGSRLLQGIRSLAFRYSVPPIEGPIEVADVGRVSPPDRVIMEENGVPLVTEHPFGYSKILFVTFDPTRPPFRGSAMERPFWQDVIGRACTHRYVPYASNGIAASSEFKQMKRRLGLMPPSPWILISVLSVYLTLLAFVLLRVRMHVSMQQLQPILFLLVFFLAISLAAFGIGLQLHRLNPVAAMNATLQTNSGQSLASWSGYATIKNPHSGVIPLSVADKRARIRKANTLRLPNSVEMICLPELRRWTPLLGSIGGRHALQGLVRFQIILSGNRPYAFVENQTPYPLTNAVALWYPVARTAGTIQPGEQRRFQIGTIQAGKVLGIQEPIPKIYGRVEGYGPPPSGIEMPSLLTVPLGVPLPELQLASTRAYTEGIVALSLVPEFVLARGQLYLPLGVARKHLVQAKHFARGWRQMGGVLDLQPAGNATMEVQLPSEAGHARWHRLYLRASPDQYAALRLQAFDWFQQKWVNLGIINGAEWFSISSPDRFINIHTDSLLVRLTNSTRGLKVGVRVEVVGSGESR